MNWCLIYIVFILNLKKKIGASFYDKKSLLRVLNSADEINRWDSKRNGSLKDYLGKIYDGNEFELPLNKPANLGVVKAGAIDVPAMLGAWKNRLKEAGNIIEDNLDYSMIEYGENKVKIQFKSDSIVGKKIVFCEGALGVNNPLFSWLPFNLSKGDILTLRNDKYLGGEVLNNGKFFLPQSDGTIKMGSTYEWDDLSYETKKERREELQEKAKETLSGDTILINHEAGIRPTVKDRRPFLGRNPIQKNVYILNGLGTKGAMLAPYFSEKILNFVMNDISNYVYSNILPKLNLFTDFIVLIFLFSLLIYNNWMIALLVMGVFCFVIIIFIATNKSKIIELGNQRLF